MSVHTCNSIEHARVRELLLPSECETMARALRERRGGYPKDSYDCLGDIGVELFRKAAVFALDSPEGPLSFGTIHIGRRKKNIWEPYCNWTLAYTTPSHRRQGYALQLSRAMLQHCAFLGCARIKSKAGSYLGLRLHWSLGHQVWGFCEGGEIQIDSPLPHQAAKFPTDKTPIGARGVTSRVTAMSGEELHHEILARNWQPDHDYDFLLCARS